MTMILGVLVLHVGLVIAVLVAGVVRKCGRLNLWYAIVNLGFVPPTLGSCFVSVIFLLMLRIFPRSEFFQDGKKSERDLGIDGLKDFEVVRRAHQGVPEGLARNSGEE